MSNTYELFDPTQQCTGLLPLNPIENKITFYGVSVFDVSLKDVAALADLPVGYARPGPSNRGETPFRLGLPVSTLFPGLREKYQEVRLAGSRGKLPVIMSLEGSVLPLDPDRPIPRPVPDHLVSRAELNAGPIRIGRYMINLAPLDVRWLATRGYTHVKAGGQTVRLNLETAPNTSGGSIGGIVTWSGLSWIGRAIRPAHLPIATVPPSDWPDDRYEEIMLGLLADRRSGVRGFSGSERLAREVSQLSDSLYQIVRRSYRNDPRFVGLMLRVRRGPLGAVHARPRLPRYDIGLFTVFEQRWTLKGYSRGALVNSLTLAPQEELTIEVFTFDRRKVEEERTLTSEFEGNSEIGAMTNIAANIARELSETYQLSGDVGLGLPLPVGGMLVEMNVGSTASLEVKAEIQASLTQVSEMTSRVTERFKATRQVKVLEARETGREDRITRKIRNPNQGHTLTLNCYEVLETYRVETFLKSAKQFCLLVEQPNLGAVDVPFVLAYQDRLQRALLSKIYLTGFDAARSLYAQGWFDNASIQRAELEEAASAPLAANAPRPPRKPVVVVARQLAKALEKLFDVDLLEEAEVLENYYNPFDGVDVSERDKASAEAALGLFNYAFKLKLVSSGIEDRARTFLAALEDDDSEAAVVEALGSFLSGADDEWITNLKMLAASVVAANLASLLLIPFPLLAPVLISLAVIENNAGYPGLVGKAKQELKAYEVTASVIPPGAADAGAAANPPARQAPPQLFSLQDLAAARADFDALRLHIEANRMYYMNQIWKAEDPDARFERFRQSGIDGFVDNRLIGFAGDRAIFPLRLSALGLVVGSVLEQKLTAFDATAAETAGSGSAAVSVGPIEVAAETYSLPTPAVYMEGALGRCELLEPYLIGRRDIERRIAAAEAELAEIRVASARTAAGLPAPSLVLSPAPATGT